MSIRILFICLAVLGACSACSKKLPKGEIERIPQTESDTYYQNYYETPPLK